MSQNPLPRVLFLGEYWFGSCARACSYALRRLGVTVQDVDQRSYFPDLRRLPARIVRRLLRPMLVREYNDAILREADSFNPEVLLAFKGPLVLPQTLRRLRARGIILYNYYPDTSAFAHGDLLPQALPEYDCVFYTKRFWDGDVRARISLRDSVFLDHGYDPDVHHPWSLSNADLRLASADVVLVAVHTCYKERVMEELVRLRPQLNLRIWGDGWRERCRSDNLARVIQGRPVFGDAYAQVLSASSICLAVMSGPVEGASQGDEVTTRTFEIPAVGAFMLHERNPEVLSLFREGKEIDCFSSARELADKIDYYLMHPEQRQAIARAGHQRCVPAYSYDRRMACILQYQQREFQSQLSCVSNFDN